MTTASKQDNRAGVSVLLRAAGAAVVAGLVAVALAALVSGATAASSVALGAGLVVTVIGFGAFVLNTVASLMPGATVLVALVTYALQLVVLAAVLLVLVRDGLLEDVVHRQWFGGGIAVGALAWVVAQVVASMRARIPVYDLPEAGAR